MSQMVPGCFQVNPPPQQVPHVVSQHSVLSCQEGSCGCFQGRVPCAPSPHARPPESLLAQDGVPHSPWSRDAEIPWRSPSSLRGQRPLSVPSLAAGPSRGSRVLSPPPAPRRGQGGEGGPSPLRSAPLGLGPPPPRPFIPGLNLGCARAAASLPPRPGRVSSAPAIGLRPPQPAL